MNLLYNKARNTETADIRARIFNVLPAASFQLEKLLGLLDIEYSDHTETACVECRDTPRLLLNRRFVEEYCADDGDLFLLILHELYHVILGHTRLFPRVDRIDNIAFDAVINSLIANTVGRSVGVRLFTVSNGWENFPARLLRPPPGWPHSIEPALVGLPHDEVRVIRLLYGKKGGALTYHDVYALLRKSLGKKAAEATGETGRRKQQIHAPGNASCDTAQGHSVIDPGERTEGDPDAEALTAGVESAWEATLLGNHGDSAEPGTLLTETVRRIAEGWPPPPFRILGRDEGRSAEGFILDKEQMPGAAFIRAFKAVLRRCGIYSGAGPAVYRREWMPRECIHESVVPDERDRRVSALKTITGYRPLIYRSLETQVRPRPRRAPVVHLYLDVSGSMAGYLPYLTATCREPFRKGQLKVFAFSTVVSEVKGSDLTKAPIENTHGTDINAVLSHAGAIPTKKRPKVILIVTDGYVGPARGQLLTGIGRTRTVAALTHPSYEADLKPWVSELNQLPKP